MVLSLYIDKQQAEVRIFKFPAGESGVSFSTNARVTDGRINACITLAWQGNDDLINLALLVDAIRRKYDVDLSLNIPYFPYARQDRVCNPGESLSVKVIAEIINHLNFTRVFVTDPHSEVLGAVLSNMVSLDMSSRVLQVLAKIIDPANTDNQTTLVSPDAGANKKILHYAKISGGAPVIRADKTRHTATGEITGTVVYSEHLGKTNLLVVDDLLDGGGTFIPLAKELRKITTGSVNLLVSHGIFTKGVDIFQGLFDSIFVVNNMYGPHPLIKEIQ